MIKHTPGPWRQSHRRTSAEAWNTQVYDEAGRTIATLDWYPVNLSGGIVGSAREANARLIAVAPVLLCVVKDIDEWERTYPTFRIYSEGATRKMAAELTAIVERGRAAIREAEGPNEAGEQGLA